MSTPKNPDEDAIAKAIQEVMDGKPVYELAGWTEQQIKDLHRKAFNNYSEGNYPEALELFKALVVLNSTDSRVWMGYAGTAMMLKRYEDAIKAYGHASLFDPRRPEPFFYAMECHLALDHPEEAKVAAEHVLHLAGGHSEFTEFSEKASLVLSQYLPSNS